MTNALPISHQVLGLMARWQAFSEIQQRAFAFLAAEALATGSEFEDSANGAAGVLTRIADTGPGQNPEDLRSEVWGVVHRLQSADRSRQGLEQVASVLTMLTRQHEALEAETIALAHSLPTADGFTETCIGALTQSVSLGDWRRRLIDALHGRDPGPRAINTADDEELF
jgi:hypothetical protein